jgi:hypothetical protein
MTRGRRRPEFAPKQFLTGPGPFETAQYSRQRPACQPRLRHDVKLLGGPEIGVTVQVLHTAHIPFFVGTRSGNSYTGYAKVFSKSCGAIAYPVTGTISADERQVALAGQMPIRDENCQVLYYSDDLEVLSFLDTN